MHDTSLGEAAPEESTPEERPPEESSDERLRRNLNELLQELRVAQAGIQILFGFLLAVAFTDSFLRGTVFQHVVHLVTSGFALAATALLTAPAAWHRVLFRQGQRPRIVRMANRFALGGMACLACALSGTVLLLVDVAIGTTAALVAGALVLVGFATLWFVLPLRHSDRRNRSEYPETRS